MTYYYLITRFGQVRNAVDGDDRGLASLPGQSIGLLTANRRR